MFVAICCQGYRAEDMDRWAVVAEAAREAGVPSQKNNKGTHGKYKQMTNKYIYIYVYIYIINTYIH